LIAGVIVRGINRIMQEQHVGIIGWQKNSFIDYPGTIATVLFFKGCNLRCPWCHNPDIVFSKLPEIDFNVIEQFIQKRRSVIHGVVLTGGEPTLHSALEMVAERIRRAGMNIKLDTNGLNPEAIRKIAPDYCALDIKTSLDNYSSIGYKPGDSEKRLHESIEIVRSMGEHAEIRITVVEPYINEKVICDTGRLIKGVSKVYLQRFKNSGALVNSDAIGNQHVTDETLAAYRERLLGSVSLCEIRNG
jgi:pyruvate formate lyase activating enzyme